jgi:hypothetical protein
MGRMARKFWIGKKKKEKKNPSRGGSGTHQNPPQRYR